MKIISSVLLRRCLCFLTSLFATASVFGQAGLQNIQYTVATTTRDGGGRDWAYLVWDATTPALLNGRQYAIYMKTGDPASPALFRKVGVVQRQTDPRVISSLLQRSVHLGDNLAELEDGISKMFQSMSNAATLPLPEKISAILRGSTGQPAFEVNLRLLAKAHPGLAFCLGLGHAELIAPALAVSTFEVREFDPVKARELGVVGRVIVTAGAPVTLPAPGAPACLPEENARGHLNAKLRWATPDDLRRVSLLNFGFNVWRVNAPVARARGWTSSPPATAQLLGAANMNGAEIRRVSDIPVLRSRDFDSVSVTNFSPTGDTKTFFFADDNARFRGGQPFNDGDEFYYFVTARDLLGRDGVVSSGTFVRMCRRLPPGAPTDVRVENDYTWANGISNQVLKVNWPQSVNGPGTNIASYWVYRWLSATQHVAYESNPLFNRIAMVPHLPGTNRNQFLDNGQSAPVLSTNVDETFWYTVRAVDLTACGDLPSPHSGLAYGVLRDRVGPEAPSGGVDINCATPGLDPVPNLTLVTEAGLEPRTAYFGVRGVRTHPLLAFAEFKATVEAAPPALLTPVEYETVRVDFDPATGEAGANYAVPRAWGNSVVTFQVRVGISDELISRWETFQINPGSWPAPGQRRVASIVGSVTVSPTPVYNLEPAPIRLGRPRVDYTPFALPPLWSITIPVIGLANGLVKVQTSSDLRSWRDWPQSPVTVSQGRIVLSYNSVFGAIPHQFYRVQPLSHLVEAPCAHYADPASPEIKVNMFFKRDTKEYRLYRRIDDGPLTLLAQGQADYDAGVVRTQRLSDAWPASAKKICHFAQAIDRHGNASPMVQLGDCIKLLATEVPCPVLSAIVATNGPNGEAQMLLNWFCPPDGVDRFRIIVSTNKTSASPSRSAEPRRTDMIFGGAPAQVVHRRPTGTHALAKPLNQDFTGSFDTSQVGAEIGPGPQYRTNVNVATGVTYFVQVIALGPGGTASSCQKTRQFTYKARPVSGPGRQVPWPNRPLPTVSEWSEVRACLMPTTNGSPGIDPYYPVGIRIGSAVFRTAIEEERNCQPGIGPCRPPAFADEIGLLQAAAAASGATGMVSVVTNRISSPANPLLHLFPAGENALEKKIFPVVLYRSQVANASFPAVSRDLVQASPLLEKIAYYRDPNPIFVANSIELKDPFIRATVTTRTSEQFHQRRRPPWADTIGAPPTCFCDYYLVTTIAETDFYLLDTQPVLAGATYQYTLVRFNPATREPEHVIPAGTVTIPEN